MPAKRPDYQTPHQAAQRWGVSRQWVMQLLDRGLIPGARREIDVRGKTVCLIPRTAKRPTPDGKPGPKPKERSDENA